MLWSVVFIGSWLDPKTMADRLGNRSTLTPTLIIETVAFFPRAMFEPGQPYQRDDALLEELGYKTGMKVGSMWSFRALGWPRLNQDVHRSRTMSDGNLVLLAWWC